MYPYVDKVVTAGSNSGGNKAENGYTHEADDEVEDDNPPRYAATFPCLSLKKANLTASEHLIALRTESRIR